MHLDFKRSERGFLRADFVDYYNAECSIQASSLAFPAAIWFGINDAEVKIMVPGQGWQNVPLPDGATIFSRMHLTQDQVLSLLPALSHFAATGCLPEEGEPSSETASLVTRISELEAEIVKLKRGIRSLAQLANLEIADED